MESKIERWGIAPGITGVRIVNKNAIGVANDAIGIEKKTKGNGAAVVLASNPAENAVVIAQVLRPALGFIATMGALRIDQGLKSLGFDNEFGFWFRLSPAGHRANHEEREAQAIAHSSSPVVGLGRVFRV